MPRDIDARIEVSLAGVSEDDVHAAYGLILEVLGTMDGVYWRADVCEPHEGAHEEPLDLDEMAGDYVHEYASAYDERTFGSG